MANNIILIFTYIIICIWTIDTNVAVNILKVPLNLKHNTQNRTVLDSFFLETMETGCPNDNAQTHRNLTVD